MAQDYSDKDLPRWLAAHMRRVQRAVASLEHLDNLVDVMEQDGYDLLGFSVKLGHGGGDSVLVTVRATGPDGGPLVGFCGAATPVLALAKLVKEIRSDEWKWRHDEYR